MQISGLYRYVRLHQFVEVLSIGSHEKQLNYGFYYQTTGAEACFTYGIVTKAEGIMKVYGMLEVQDLDCRNDMT